MESSKGNINVYVHPTNSLGDVAVGICFKVDLNSCVMNRLNNHRCCDCIPSGSEVSCAAYALYLAVYDKLCGNPLAVKNSKVGRVSVGYNNSHLFFTWNMKGIVSHVRKALGMAMSAMKPSGLFSLYGHCMRKIGGKVKKEHFNSAVNKLINGIKQGVECCVVGKINMGKSTSESKNKVDDMANKINNKLDPGSTSSSSSSSSEYKDVTDCDHSDYTELKVNGWHAFVVSDYIRSKARGLEPIICNKNVLVPVKPSNYESLKTKLKKQVSSFVDQKYKKLGDECGPVLAYLAVSNSNLSCADAKKLCKVKLPEISQTINNNL